VKLDPDGNLDLHGSEAEYLSPWWFAASLGLGGAIVGVGVLGSERYGWHDVYVSVCINIGTAVGLVGMLLLLERQLLRRLRSALLKPPMCTLASPPTPIRSLSVFGSATDPNGNNPYGCGHSPEHRWNSITGQGLADHLDRDERLRAQGVDP
jgi:hypothetical protein